MNRYFPVFLVFGSLVFTACAAAPREVTPGESSGSSQAAATPSTSSAIAVGHGSGAPPAAAPAAPMSAQSGSTPVKWTAPSRWQTGPEKPMRAATYLIPAASGDSEGAECAVFKDIGGGVDANIKRWIGQFEQPDGGSSESKAKRNKETINGFQVSTVDLTGVFTGMNQATNKTNYRLLGAIVETPQGEVFFKMTGPVKTMAAAQGEFQSLLKSLK